MTRRVHGFGAEWMGTLLACRYMYLDCEDDNKNDPTPTGDAFRRVRDESESVAIVASDYFQETVAESRMGVYS